jgi:hypothetical protein
MAVGQAPEVNGMNDKFLAYFQKMKVGLLNYVIDRKNLSIGMK